LLENCHIAAPDTAAVVERHIEANTTPYTRLGTLSWVNPLTSSYYTIFPQHLEIRVGNPTLTAAVEYAPADGAKLIAAWYDENGRLLGITSADVAEGCTTKAFTVTADAAQYRLMLVDRAAFVPLCAAAEAGRE